MEHVGRRRGRRRPARRRQRLCAAPCSRLRSAAIRTRTRRASTRPRSSPTRSPSGTRSSPRSRPAASSTAARQNIAWATSTNGGRTWTTGFLPGTTQSRPAGPWARISDPAVAYDPMHDVWMISTLALRRRRVSGAGAILTSRSTDGGLTWQNPVTIVDSAASSTTRTGSSATTWPSSPLLRQLLHGVGRQRPGNRMQMSTSTDGGLTWGAGRRRRRRQRSRRPAGRPAERHRHRARTRQRRAAISVLPLDRRRRQLGRLVSRSRRSQRARRRRRPPHLAAALGRGRRRRQGLRRLAGLPLPLRLHRERHRLQHLDRTASRWSAVTRVPIDPTNSGVDHFIPGIAVDKATSGGTAHLALGYYYYPVSTCSSHVPAHRRLRLVARRRRDLERADTASPGR